MIIIITGASHTGKTMLAQKLLEHFKFPYLSIDHLKMGLIRSGQTNLTPCHTKELTPYLWSIVKEMIKTAIENGQNMIIEGCYIPFNWKEDFSERYLNKIKYVCLVFSKNYIENNFSKIKNNANVIESRIEDDYTKEAALNDNAEYLQGCKQYNCFYYEINNQYNIDDIAKNLLA